MTVNQYKNDRVVTSLQPIVKKINSSGSLTPAILSNDRLFAIYLFIDPINPLGFNNVLFPLKRPNILPKLAPI
jgi:hypothetical protein